MKKEIKTAAVLFAFFCGANFVLADQMIFEPISIDSNSASKAANVTKSSTITKTDTKDASVQSANFQNALFQLDAAQVDLRNNLVELKSKYTDVDAQYKVVKEERKLLNKEVKALEKKIKNLDKTKENIRKSM